MIQEDKDPSDLRDDGDSVIQHILDSEGSLTHFGVKGMKWGKRKDRVGLVGNVKLNLKAQREFNDAKQGKLVDKAKSGDYTIEAAFKGDLSAKVLSGKEFVDRIAKGDKLNVPMSDIHAGRAKAHPNDKGPIFVQVRDWDKVGQYKWKNYNKK